MAKEKTKKNKKKSKGLEAKKSKQIDVEEIDRTHQL
jgi:hypothetical protein